MWGAPTKALGTHAHKRHCGTWQDNYIKLHNDILAGNGPQRYAIAVAAPSGLSGTPQYIPFRPTQEMIYLYGVLYNMIQFLRPFQTQLDA